MTFVIFINIYIYIYIIYIIYIYGKWKAEYIRADYLRYITVTKSRREAVPNAQILVSQVIG